jgi:hypothetical protein
MQYLTKDEIRLFHSLLKDHKYDLLKGSKEEQLNQVEAYDNLSSKLECCIQDKRRIGRTSQDSFSDLLNRIVKKYS